MFVRYDMIVLVVQIKKRRQVKHVVIDTTALRGS